ncbi:MAG: ComF family protein [Alphaproteobacteria bacterium]
MPDRAGKTSDAHTPRTVFHRVGGLCRKAPGKLADFILPPLCLVCRSSVMGHAGLCSQCWSKIDFIEPPRCDRLGIPLPFPSDETVISAAALADPPVYDRARAVARYDGVMRELIHTLKYGDRHEGVALFSKWMIHAGADILEDADILIPVPLARLRLWSRRFNQSALLARAVAHSFDIIDDPTSLERTRRTASQVGLSAEQRKKNVAGAFRVPDRKRAHIEGRNVLLIDDVITTGATADACARTLKRAGAARVDVLALARVVDPLTPTL